METVKITKKRYTQIFGGMGFNNIEAMMYKAIEKEHFDQILCKCYREVAPGFMRTLPDIPTRQRNPWMRSASIMSGCRR